MPVDLKKLSVPINEELKKFEEIFKLSLKSKVFLVNQIGKYILQQKSKRIRPILVLLSARACGEINQRTYLAASLVELLHTATLIHDDVVDHADTRRGMASINAVWHNKIAVLIGDYFLAKGLLSSLENDEFRFLMIVSESVKRMSEGELLQIQKAKQLDIDEKTYFKIIADKTASLISACCEVGAVSTTLDEDIIKCMKVYGESIGMAFQIQDDLLDYTGEKSVLGKSIGMDIKEKKITLPLIYSVNNAKKSESKKILELLKDIPQKKQINYIIDFVKENGGIEYTREKAGEFIELAIGSLRNIPASEAKESLISLSNFIIDRDY
jgi:octaprenyl-diphosphate synthase